MIVRVTMLHAIAYLSLATLFVAHWRELVIMDNYTRTSARSMFMFASDPLIMAFAALTLHDVLLSSTLGTIALAALIAEFVAHLVVYYVHFTRRPLSIAASTLHNVLDSVVTGCVLLVAAQSLTPGLAVTLSLLAVPVGMLSVSLFKWGLDLEQSESGGLRA